MNSALRNAIARIDIVQAGTSGSRGTGFLVAPDLVLTAFHVVADRSARGVTPYPGRIALTFPTQTTDATVVDDRADPRADWVLLRCQTPPTHVRPIPLADRVEDGASWETYGFPDANPRDGMVQIGSVENAGGTFEGVPAYQLFSRQAAAGTGAPVKGLSGGPVIVEGAIVGLLRSSLMRDGQNVAGTLYGCPIDAILERCDDLLPIPDPVRGLPGFARRALPATPFRFLERFTWQDAEIFFGRNVKIRQLYNHVTSADGTGVILLFGQSGAGKSSFLDAGLLPRLEASHATAYVRRDRAKGLVATLLDAVASALPVTAGAATSSALHAAEALRLAWLGREAAAGRPLVVVLDQVEEVFTLPSDDADELTTLVDALSQLFQRGSAPHGRVILGFRKEWFAEIQTLLKTRDVEYEQVFLDALDRKAVTEIVTGLQRTKRLCDRYGLDVEDGLADAIGRDVTADRNSPVAPMLQVLLSRMWREATTESSSTPHFTIALYERLRDEGFQLTDFLNQQLTALARAVATTGGAVAEIVESGLALDVLRFHITERGTARTVSAKELHVEYFGRNDIQWLVQQLKSLYLLSEPAGDARQTTTETRLAHDTLAAPVWARFDASDLPGQRARRILENRAVEWRQGRTGTPLDARDLTLAEQGLAGMRAPHPDEDRLLRASQAVHDLSEAQSEAVAGVGSTTRALALLARALRRDAHNITARAWAFDFLASLPRSRTEISWALGEHTEHTGRAVGAPLSHQGAVNAATFSPDGTRVVTASNDKTARVWNAHTGQAVGRPLQHQDAVKAAAFSANGKRLLTESADETALLWNLRAKQLLGAPLQRVEAINAYATRVVTVSDDGRTQLWDAHTRAIRPIGPRPHQDDATAAVFSPDGTMVVTTSHVDETAQVWNAHTGRAITEPLQLQDLVSDMAFSPDGTSVVAALASGGARVWNARTGQATGPLLQHSVVEWTPALSAGGTHVVTAFGDNAGQVRDARTGRAVGAPLQHQDRVNAAAFSADGTRVVTVSDDKTARVWDARTGQAVGAPLQHQDRVNAAAFSPDGTRVVTASDDNTARLWDVQVGTPDDAAKLADLAEVLGGVRLSAIGVFEQIDIDDLNDRLEALRLQAAEAEVGKPGAASFIRWWLAVPWTRSTSPLSQMLVAEYLDRMLAMGAAGRVEAKRVFLGHPRLKRASR